MPTWGVLKFRQNERSPGIPGMRKSRTEKGLPFLWGVLLFLFSCTPQGPGTPLQRILQKGEIKVITRNNAHCYYFYRDQPMGFEYELSRAFADFLGVKLKVEVAHRWEQMIPDLLKGRGDLIAASLTITPSRKCRVAFSEPYMEIRQRLIVHHTNRSIHLEYDLSGQTVVVRKGTSYQERLEALRAKGINVDIRLLEDIPTEELIRRVAEGAIPVTIADSHIAKLNRRYYPKAVISGPISHKEYLGWAVHPDAHDLLERINAFFAVVFENGRFEQIYNRYYADVDAFDYMDLGDFHRRMKTHLPQYQEIIEAAAQTHGLDWRLIAAQVYQESRFEPEARSPQDAHGLMQLIPSSAKRYGVEDLLNPEENIRAGVKLLKDLYQRYPDADAPDRIRMALAAYNAGAGHIQDGIYLAKRMGLNPNRWSALVRTLPLLSYQKYYRDARYGYCRGSETVQYVQRVMIYYDILKRAALEYEVEPSTNL
ncbi:MAG: membrane-bound lytic murein transglycosylase MltF [Deltaproteobacteria bacterium]|nr:membrane-bound lytic murein transglycosylase MltF [Deltaproteobacteria bacterium]MBW2040459.1 membrane-bound lytic murein transglycosylase MltF [Deltaproteobacteria bacterium]MBW2131884.1 membrane-bound lytic murein transglycosylase MltF [Deltaproteobacteria bacterium]